MSGGTAEIHTDSEYAFTATHQGANAATAFVNRDYRLDAFITVGVYAENETQSTGGEVTAVAGSTLTVDGVTWNNGDTCKTYKTATKSSRISTQWTDVSRGWKTPQRELEDGWKPEDIDEDRD